MESSTPQSSTRRTRRILAESADYEWVDVAVRVRYAETDQMQVAYYANYFVWFEIGRTEFLRSRGFSYRDLEEEEGCYIVVADAACSYRSPAHYDDVLTIRTFLKEARSRVVTFGYEVLDESEHVIATGETVHVVTDRAGKPRALPERYRKALEPITRP
jgi:acyl-CoA thioester hydrolase